MNIGQEKLESEVTLINYGATILGTGLIVEDLEINSAAFGFEARNDAVVGSNVMRFVA